MARRHWRFVVRDRYGYTIQNAKVNVFQPGTSTDFTGTAHDAASGGNVLTNPFTTNQFGEVEAWFSDEQDVDVRVDDNVDQAYRAVDGSGTPISFTTFTEADSIYLGGDDALSEAEHHVIGTASDLQDITLALQAEAVGASGRFADGAHIHGHVAFAGDPHSAATHTDIERSIFLPVNDGVVLAGGTLASLGATPNIIRTISLADAATNGAVWAFVVPDDWASGGLDVTVYFAGATTTTGTVRWTITAKKRAEGEDVTVAGTAVSYTSDAPTTANFLVIDPTQNDVVTPAVAGELIMIGVQRIGADGADTYAAVAHIIGIRVDYTANQ